MARARASKRGNARTVALLGCVLLVPASGCGDEQSGQEPAAPVAVPVPEAEEPRDVAVLDVEGFGEIRIELLPELAPRTVENFVRLAGEKFYDGTTFHRVIPGFMIQGGDPLSRNRDPRDDGKGGPGYAIPDEPSDVSYLRGVVAMANLGRAGTAGSQFFILVEDRLDLPPTYTVFGHVTAGMDVVDRIANTSRDLHGRHGPRDRPLENVVVASIAIEEGGDAAATAPSPGAAEGGAPAAAEWDEGGL